MTSKGGGTQMKHLFLVQGSAPEPYNVEFSYTEEKFSAQCDCPAGLMGTLCKHILSILEGEIPKGLVDGDTKKIPNIITAFKNSEVGSVYEIFKDTEVEVEQLKKEMKNRKKQVARMLYQ